MTTAPDPDLSGPRGVIETYIAGSRRGDVASLESVFDTSAWMYGDSQGRAVATPIDGFFELVRKSGPVDAGAYSASIVSVDTFGRTAVATIDEQAFHGRDYRSVFTLLRGPQGWRIVSKLFSTFP